MDCRALRLTGAPARESVRIQFFRIRANSVFPLLSCASPLFFFGGGLFETQAGTALGVLMNAHKSNKIREAARDLRKKWKRLIKDPSNTYISAPKTQIFVYLDVLLSWKS